MKRTKPPFRADHVGSLLRSGPLKQARARRERGDIGAEELKAIEDDEIVKVIKKQEDIGLRAVTDGEFRRAFWNYDFLGRLDGVEAYLGERKIKFQGPNPKPMMLRVTGKLGTFSGHPMLEHFKFVQAHTRVTPKMTIPSRRVAFSLRRDAVPDDLSDMFLPRSRRLRKPCALATPVAAICSSTRSISPISAIRVAQVATAATIRKSCRRSMPT